MSIKLLPPQLTDEAPDLFDQFLNQFTRYLRVAKITEADSQLDILLLCVGSKVAGYYDEVDWEKLTQEEVANKVTVYSRAVNFLRNKLSGGRNILHERIQLYNSRQRSNQSLNDFLTELRTIGRRCDFPTAFAEEALRDAFCQGLFSDETKKAVCRQFATVHKAGLPFTLMDAVNVAEVEVSTQKVLETPSLVGSQEFSTVAGISHPQSSTNTSTVQKKCYWCGAQSIHGRLECPAKDKQCRHCQGIGHFQSVCKKKKYFSSNKNSSSCSSVTIATVNGGGARRFVNGSINGKELKWLIDSGSEISIVKASLAKELGIMKRLQPGDLTAQSITGAKLKILGKCDVTVSIQDAQFLLVIYVVQGIAEEAVLGMSGLINFKGLELHLNGPLPSLMVSSCHVVMAEFAEIFDGSSTISCQPHPIIVLSKEAKPIRRPSRVRSLEDKEFITCEINELLKKGIIQPSQSPWRAQVVVTKSTKSKKRMVVDYSLTINKFTVPDAFPIPLMDDVLTTISKWKVFTTIDLRNAYYQVPLRPEEYSLTAFEADGKLFEFTRLPFGVTNGVAGFCRVVSEVVKDLPGVVNYLDDIVVGGDTQQEHDANLKAFLVRAREKGLSLNSSKCRFGVDEVFFLGHHIQDGKIKPDPARLSPLLDFPTPNNLKELQRLIGLLTYYSKWVPNFATISKPLMIAKTTNAFPLDQLCTSAIQKLKEIVASSHLHIPVKGEWLTLETDASSTAVAGILSQNGRPVGFFSHKLTDVEKKWAAIELEAFAIIQSVKKFRQFLLGNKFCLLTDQQGISYVLGNSHRNGVKNSKINRWRLELAEYSFQIQYRPGPQNTAADALSRVSSCQSNFNNGDQTLRQLVSDIHNNMGHPGINRTTEYIKSQLGITGHNQVVKEIISKCTICAKNKPVFFRPPEGELIQAKRPWQRLSIDFSGPKPSTNEFRYIFTVVDEYSRFPFAFALKEMSTQSAISCLEALFLLFGPPDCVHSDRGSQFESKEFQNFMCKWNIIKSRTTPYHPNSNGQVERFNKIIWDTLVLRLSQKRKPITEWKDELTWSLTNIRALPSRAIGFQTPHQLFLAFHRRSTLSIPQAPPYSSEEVTCNVLPAWLTENGSVLLKRFGIKSKFEDKVQKVYVRKILSPYHVMVEFENGRQETVSTAHLSRLPEEAPCELTVNENNSLVPLPNDDTDEEVAAPLRRSRRKVQTPKYLSDYEL